MTGVDDESIDEMEASETVEPEEDDPEGALCIYIPAIQPYRNYFSRARLRNTHNSPIIHHLTTIRLISLSICA
jgi:hypothetical protein